MCFLIVLQAGRSNQVLANLISGEGLVLTCESTQRHFSVGVDRKLSAGSLVFLIKTQIPLGHKTPVISSDVGFH